MAGDSDSVGDGFRACDRVRGGNSLGPGGPLVEVRKSCPSCRHSLAVNGNGALAMCAVVDGRGTECEGHAQGDAMCAGRRPAWCRSPGDVARRRKATGWAVGCGIPKFIVAVVVLGVGFSTLRRRRWSCGSSAGRSRARRCSSRWAGRILTPTVEVGARRDGGNAEIGAGLELGVLVAPSDDAYRE